MAQSEEDFGAVDRRARVYREGKRVIYNEIASFFSCVDLWELRARNEDIAFHLRIFFYEKRVKIYL